MKHLRADYDCIQAYPTKREHYLRVDGEVQHFNVGDELPEGAQYEPIIPDDEPVFLLRAQDPSAAYAVLAWASHAETHGADPELVARTREWSQEMRRWSETHGKTVADVPAGALR